MAGDEARTPPRTFGRRKGRTLRAGWQNLLDERLPQVRIPLTDEDALDPRALFSTCHEAIWLEIGFGAGEHLAWQAERHPEIGFLGAEVFVNGIASLLRHMEDKQLRNVRILPDDARHLLTRLLPGSVERVFVLFPDPWPKARHHNRRLIQSETLDSLAAIMQPGGELRFASDDSSYVTWALQHLMQHADFEWIARQPADWRRRPVDWPETRYEAKAREAGRRPIFLRFRRRPH